MEKPQLISSQSLVPNLNSPIGEVKNNSCGESSADVCDRVVILEELARPISGSASAAVTHELAGGSPAQAKHNPGLYTPSLAAGQQGGTNASPVSTPSKPSPFTLSSLDQVPVNLERLDEVARGDVEFQRELLQVFMEDALNYLEEIKSALLKGDHPTLARLAHQLKGSSATVAIRRMPELAVLLENQAQNNQLAGAAGLITELEQILERLQAFITNDQNWPGNS
jgi:HPt (histidine-containing phosphotransfer) domain-containing protein